MDEKELKKLEEQLEKLGITIDTKLKEQGEKYAAASKEAREAILKDLEPQLKQYNDLNAKLDKVQGQLDEVNTKIQRLPFGSPEAKKNRQESMKDVLMQLKKEGGGSLRTWYKKHKSSGEIELKVDDMTQANSFESTAVVQAMHVPGIVYDPDTADRIRNFILPGSTTSNSIEYVKEAAETFGTYTAVTSEGAEYKQGDVDLQLATATVRKITAYCIVSEEMLDDVEGLQSYLSARMSSKLKLAENYELLYGDGTGIHLSGLTTNATAYSDELADSLISEIDVLVSAIKQVRTSEYNPTFVLIHPTEALKIKLTKDSSGQYIQPWIFMGNKDINLDGVSIIVTTAITAGDFLVGAREAAQVFDRRQMTLEMTNVNEDNFVKGMVTVRINERLTIAVYRAKALIYGTFASALAKGSA